MAQMVNLDRMDSQVEHSAGAVSYRPPRLYVRPRHTWPSTTLSSLAWLRRPGFLNGVASVVEISGRNAWYQPRRFRPRRDAEMLVRDMLVVGSDLKCAERRCRDAQQHLFDPDHFSKK